MQPLFPTSLAIILHRAMDLLCCALDTGCQSTDCFLFIFLTEAEKCPKSTISGWLCALYVVFFVFVFLFYCILKVKPQHTCCQVVCVCFAWRCIRVCVFIVLVVEGKPCADQMVTSKVMIHKAASRIYPLIDLLGDNLIPQQYLLIILQVNYVQNRLFYPQMNTKPYTYL